MVAIGAAITKPQKAHANWHLVNQFSGIKISSDAVVLCGFAQYGARTPRALLHADHNLDLAIAANPTGRFDPKYFKTARRRTGPLFPLSHDCTVILK